MNTGERIELLISENELLALQLADLEHLLKKRDAEIHFLGDATESAASLQSRIDGNLAQIEQLKQDSDAAARTTTGIEMMVEELELSLFKETRIKQQQEKEIKSLGSVKTELDIISGELEEATGLYVKLQKLQNELTVEKSKAELLEAENADLRTEMEELRALVKELRTQKLRGDQR